MGCLRAPLLAWDTTDGLSSISQVANAFVQRCAICIVYSRFQYSAIYYEICCGVLNDLMLK